MRLMSLALAMLTVAVGLVCASAPAAAHTTHAIAMANYAFVPSAMTIEAGDTVVWTNSDQAQHDVMVTSGPAQIHSPMLSKGQQWSFTFTVPGTYHYVCSVHPDMVATLTVAPHSSPSPVVTPSQVTQTSAAGSGQPPVQHTTHAGTSHTSHPATPESTAASSPSTSAVAAAAAPASPPSASHPLKPLLLLAGLIAAIATFCLLLLAARPDEVPATE